jgi:hypothetical protein
VAEVAGLLPKTHAPFPMGRVAARPCPGRHTNLSGGRMTRFVQQNEESHLRHFPVCGVLRGHMLEMAVPQNRRRLDS